MDTILLESGIYSLHLSGSGIAPPVRGARRRPPERLPHGRTREVIEVALEGDGSLSAVPRLAELICARARQGRRAYLKVADPGGELYRSLLLDGWVETLGRGPDSAGLRLTLVRADEWEGNLIPVDLCGLLETSASGVRVFRRCDQAGTGVAALVLLPEGAASQPAPVRLEISNDAAPDAPAIGDVYVLSAQDQNDLSSAYRVEAEWGSPGAGVSAQTLANAGCSGGYFVRYTWNSASAVRLAYWALPQMVQNLCAGRPVRPLVRLHAPWSGGDCWVHWRVATENGSVLATGEPVLLAAGRQFHPLPALHFPAGTAGSYLGERVELWGMSAAPAELEMDVWLLLPAEGFRRYTALDTLPAGWSLVDDGVDSDLVYARHEDSGQRRETHRAEGPPLAVWPGGRQAFFLAWETPTQASIEGQVRLRLFTRPRVKEI